MAVGGGGYGVAPGYVPQPKVSFDAIGEAWRMFQQEMGTWLLASLVILGIIVVPVFAMVMFMFTGMGLMTPGGGANNGGAAAFGLVFFLGFTVIIIVMMLAMAAILGGMYRMALKQLRGEPIRVADMFDCKDVLPNLIGAAILTGLAAGAGSMFCYIPGLIIAGLFMLTTPLIVDRRMGATEAMSASWNALKGDTLMATCFYFVVTIISILLSPFTMPLLVLSVTVVYRDFFLANPAQTGVFPAYPGQPGYPAARTEVPPSAGPSDYDRR